MNTHKLKIRSELLGTELHKDEQKFNQVLKDNKRLTWLTKPLYPPSVTKLSVAMRLNKHKKLL